jgi:hypothetical protein
MAEENVAVHLSMLDWTVVREILEQTMNAKTLPGAWQMINIYEALNRAGVPSIHDVPEDPIIKYDRVDEITSMDPSTESEDTEDTN